MKLMLAVGLLMMGLAECADPDAGLPVLWREDNLGNRTKLGVMAMVDDNSKCELRLDDGGIRRAQKSPPRECYQALFEAFLRTAPPADYAWGRSIKRRPSGSPPTSYDRLPDMGGNR